VERSRRRGLTGFLYQWKRDYCIVRETPDQHTTFPSSPQHVWDSPSFLVALPIHEKSPAQAPDFSQSGRVEPAAIDYSMICTIRWQEHGRTIPLADSEQAARHHPF
jgi:hypothetical protein